MWLWFFALIGAVLGLSVLGSAEIRASGADLGFWGRDLVFVKWGEVGFGSGSGSGVRSREGAFTEVIVFQHERLVLGRSKVAVFKKCIRFFRFYGDAIAG